MKRHIPWIDFVLYGGLALLSVVLALVFVWDTEVGGVVALLATTLGFVTVAVVVFFRWFLSQPDFVIDQYGVYVWTGDLNHLKTDTAKERLTEVLDLFVRALPEFIKKEMPENCPEQMVTSSDLSQMLYESRIEFCRNKITLFSKFGWTVKDKAGLQMGKGVMVRWTNSFIKSALYHELFHMVDEIILKRSPDYKHEEEWWKLLSKLKVAATQAAKATSMGEA